VRPNFVNVRWAPGISAEHRRDIEQRRSLVEGTQQDPRTWRYVYRDLSPVNGLALIGDPAVEDTEGIDRGTGVVPSAPLDAVVGSAGTGEVVIGMDDCGHDGVVRLLSRDQSDGRLSLRVDAPAPGLVFMSEPYYSERRAFVDGNEVPALKANLAFTAVRVPAGAHRVELRYVPRTFYSGACVSALTLLAWIGLAIKK